MKLILASKSGVRKKILDDNGIDSDVIVSNVDEDEVKASLLNEGADPLIISKNLAEIKSIKVSSKNPDRVVLGADSVISLNNELINKPKSRNEAFDILKKLNNSKHYLISSVCISKNGAMIWNHTDSSELKMKNLTDEQLLNYLNKIKTETLLAYGVYQVEAEGLRLFEYIKGDHNSIMGLPIKDIINYINKYKKMTKKYGIIGNPIKHSLSPILHNYWFKKYKIDANYSIIETENSELPNLINRIKNKDLIGINITLPYKQKIVPHIDVLINDAEITSSVNTIFLDDKGTIVGENTDVYGLQAAYLKEVDDISRKNALVIGAGGVSPSVILSLEKCGVKNISLANRTEDKCIFLKKKFKYLNIINWANLKNELKNYDIIINATSLGLKNGQDFNFNFDQVKNSLIYIDTIYNPLETKTFKYLKERNIRVFNGLEMFIYQGQKAFYLWTKINPEIDQKLIELLLSKLK